MTCSTSRSARPDFSPSGGSHAPAIGSSERVRPSEPWERSRDSEEAAWGIGAPQATELGGVQGSPPVKRSASVQGAGGAKPPGEEMFDYIISGIVSALLLVYLGWAMFKPEKF